MAEIHVGDVGTDLIARVSDSAGPVDLADYTAYVFRIKAPGATTVEVVPDVDGPPADGMLVYTTPEGFFTVPGPWQWQVKLTRLGGMWSTQVRTFTVYANI